MQLRLVTIFILNLIMAILAGCSSVKVSQDYNTAQDFNGYKRYAWQHETQAKTGDVRIDNPFLDERIRQAVDRTLAERGFQRTDNGPHDFQVRYLYTIRAKIESDDMRTGFGFGVGSRGRYGGISVSSGTSVNEYDEGMLVIDIVESQSDALLWRGTGTRRVSDHSDPEKTTKSVNELVEKILGQFPPQ